MWSERKRSNVCLDLFGKIKEGIREINVILKADVNGSQEAVKKSLERKSKIVKGFGI